MVKFEKVMTRDATLILVEAWYRAYARALPEYYGFEWVEPAFIYRNGAVESWRPTKRFFGELPITFVKWLYESPEHQERLSAAFDQYVREQELVRRMKREGAAGKDARMLVDAITTVSQSVSQAFIGLFPSFWCVQWNEIAVTAGERPIPASIMDRAMRLRTEDSLYDDANDLVYECLYGIARERHWPRELMRLFLLSELGRFILRPTEPDFGVIGKRRVGYAYVQGELVLPDELPSVLAAHGIELVVEEVLKTGTLSGIIANLGKARGTVRIVMNREQLGHVHKGDILVAPMTTPLYVPAMKKAGAILTDEGGITSHAAIISRELGIPCIIGTKVATQVFKDGDLVEVDAEKGMVRKLNESA